jgi:hypothetical protein
MLRRLLLDPETPARLLVEVSRAYNVALLRRSLRAATIAPPQ